jgi:hypothetical protein
LHRDGVAEVGETSRQAEKERKRKANVGVEGCAEECARLGEGVVEATNMQFLATCEAHS